MFDDFGKCDPIFEIQDKYLLEEVMHLGWHVPESFFIADYFT